MSRLLCQHDCENLNRASVAALYPSPNYHKPTEQPTMKRPSGGYENGVRDFDGMWIVLAVIAAVLWIATPAKAGEGLLDTRPQGFYGVGHAEHHEHYLGLRNGYGTSCCDGKDCRPTQARWNGATWDVMMDGRWITLKSSDGYKVLTAERMAQQSRVRWDAQSHVCAGKDGYIYCVIPPGSGQ